MYKNLIRHPSRKVTNHWFVYLVPFSSQFILILSICRWLSLSFSCFRSLNSIRFIHLYLASPFFFISFDVNLLDLYKLRAQENLCSILWNFNARNDLRIWFLFAVSFTRSFYVCATSILWMVLVLVLFYTWYEWISEWVCTSVVCMCVCIGNRGHTQCIYVLCMCDFCCVCVYVSMQLLLLLVHTINAYVCIRACI